MDEWMKKIKAAQAMSMGVSADGDAIESKHDQENRQLDLLKNGILFKKYKHNAPKSRLLWCNPSCDRLIWGDEQRNVKGFIPIMDITGLLEGCEHAAAMENAFTVVTGYRTIELEADNAVQKNQFMDGLRILLARKQT
eukprot:TRINITY_DN1770_c0_g1_i15.p1 TRINITY_DN1770_c0_g1~~TRINITY_DN1770_c0_g1_i15.p1  ORF type:complete len:161 (+),score=51.86 TRINITY_DN1770_c0_g1_i15:72-485(+)